MGFLGINGVLWVQCGLLGFSEVHRGSLSVHLGSVRLDGAFGIKWGSMGSIWFVETQCGLQGFFGVKWSSMGSMWFAVLGGFKWGSLGFNGVLCGSWGFL